MTYTPPDQITASGVSDQRTNNTGVTIPKATPIRINSSGELDFVDVSVEADITGFSGAASENIPNNAKGEFVNSGKISDIATTASLGDLLYISKSGDLTNQKPSIGVAGFIAGDFVVIVGVVAKNENNPLLKDLILNVDIVGQL